MQQNPIHTKMRFEFSADLPLKKKRINVQNIYWIKINTIVTEI